MDASQEPPACSGPFSTEFNGFHYIWKGSGPGEWVTTIGVYDVQTESWTLQPTTGPPPSGVSCGGCTAIANKLYCFGGYDGVSKYNELHELNLETHKWTNISSRQDQSKMPIYKAACGFVAVDETTLACFGGYGKGVIQPGSTFTGSAGSTGCTNEFHLFNLKEGVWSSPQVMGKRPPPCDGFSFTKVDQKRAVLFGGELDSGEKVHDLYLFSLKNMEVTKVKPKHPWPAGRSDFSACCLNYSDDHPQLLVFGGIDNRKNVLSDMWLLDVDSGRWTEVTLPESVKARCYHSITSSCLGPGLSEVLLFGGKLTRWGAPIAETIILRFECSPSVTGELWSLVDVAHNNTRGSSKRLKEKREISQRTQCPL